MWRLAIADLHHAFNAIVLGLCLLGVVVTSGGRKVDECRFEQTWYAGDVHFNELLEFQADSTGTWIEDGLDNDAGHEKKAFRWQRTSSTLTVTDGERQRSVPYRIERRGNHCYLTFEDHPFLVDGSGFRHFSDSGF